MLITTKRILQFYIRKFLLLLKIDKLSGVEWDDIDCTISNKTKEILDKQDKDKLIKPRVW